MSVIFAIFLMPLCYSLNGGELFFPTFNVPTASVCRFLCLVATLKSHIAGLNNPRARASIPDLICASSMLLSRSALFRAYFNSLAYMRAVSPVPDRLKPVTSERPMTGPAANPGSRKADNIVSTMIATPLLDKTVPILLSPLIFCAVSFMSPKALLSQNRILADGVIRSCCIF